MTGFYYFIAVSLLLASSVNATRSIGSRLNGDELLTHETIPRDDSGVARLKKQFDGCVITYIEFIIPPYLNESLFSLEIYEGGIFTNFVDLSVKFLMFRSARVDIKIYGMRPKSGASNDITTKSD